jgi:hypothetical protein
LPPITAKAVTIVSPKEDPKKIKKALYLAERAITEIYDLSPNSAKNI